MATWILIAQWIGRSVLVVLVGLSIWSFAIMIDRRRYFRSAQDPKAFDELKRAALAGAMPKAPEGNVAQGALRAALAPGAQAPSESVDRAVQGYLTEKQEEMEQGLTVLATLGSNAPFVGLFGTVLGIIQAFGELSSQSAGTQGVMRGIAEALVATAIGLFVAIPAVAAYNYFAKKARTVQAECEILRDLYLSSRPARDR